MCVCACISVDAFALLLVGALVLVGAWWCLAPFCIIDKHLPRDMDASHATIRELVLQRKLLECGEVGFLFRALCVKGLRVPVFCLP